MFRQHLDFASKETTKDAGAEYDDNSKDKSDSFRTDSEGDEMSEWELNSYELDPELKPVV